jgi:hypothetical protein
MVSGTTAMLAPESARLAPSSTSCPLDSAGCALSMCMALISSSMPPPTSNEASEMPKNCEHLEARQSTGGDDDKSRERGDANRPSPAAPD